MTESTSRPGRLPRLVVAALVSVSLAIVFAALGGVGFAKTAISAAQYQYGHKVTICHKGKNTITVSKNALKAHLAHGDKTGPCAQPAKNKGKAKGKGKGTDQETTTTTTTTTATTPASSPSSSQGPGKSGEKGQGQGKGKGKK